MAFNIILEALTMAMQRLEALSDVAVRLRRLETLHTALAEPKSRPSQPPRPPALLRFHRVSLQTPPRREARPKARLLERLRLIYIDL